MIEGITRVLAGVSFGVDELSVTFGLLFAVIWGLSAIYAWSTVSRESRGRFFAYYVPAAVGGILVAFAQDAVSFYLCFALMALPSWGLVAWRSDEAGRYGRRRAGALYLIAAVVGEALLLAALMILTAEAGDTSLESLRSAMLVSSYGQLAFGLIVAAFGLKLGVIGVSGILPLTYGYAPTGAAAALAGATVKVGVLGLVRLLPLGEATEPTWSAIVIGLGLATAFGAALLGSLTTTPRAVLGYSSASQMGLVLIGIGAGLAEPSAGPAAIAAAVAYSLHHGLAKATLFLGEGVSRASAGRTRTVAIAMLALPAAALVGLPLTSGFAAKYALKDAVHAAPTSAAHLAESLLPWAAVGTALLMLRFFQLVLRRESSAQKIPVVAHAVYGAMLLLVAGAVWAWPAEWVASAAKSLTHLSSLWVATWPAIVALAVGLAASWIARSVSRMSDSQIDQKDPLGLVTPGDVLVMAWQAATRLGARERAGAARSTPRRSLDWQRLGRLLTDADTTLTTWSVAAGLFVLLAALFVWIAA